MKYLKVNKNSFEEVRLKKQRRTHRIFKKITAISLSLSFVFGGIGYKILGENQAHADNENLYFSTDAYANHWGRSDLRAWMNGLDKTEDGNLPIDGSNGKKSSGNSGNFLNCFTDAELALFQPKTVTTDVFNDCEALDSDDDDKALTRTTSSYQTTDRFWAASGLHMRNHPNSYEEYLVSADPSYDLGNFYTYKQKVKNGKVNKWKNIVPIPFWGGQFGDYLFLRSASYESPSQALSSDTTTNIESYDVDDLDNECACGYVALPENIFASRATSGVLNDNFEDMSIEAYDKLGKKSRTAPPLWGMYLKKITLDNINGTLTYDSNEHTLTFKSQQELPPGKHLMIQIYKNWDLSIEAAEDGTQPETQNAKNGDVVFCADKEILNNNVTSEMFRFAGSDIPNLNGFTVKVWVEKEATNESLAQVSNPLTFLIGATEVTQPIEETKSLNPRVFAYRSDLSCSWGKYETEADCTFILHGEERFNEGRPYEGKKATYQKLYIGATGTGNNRKPIEWWVAGSDDNGLTLYQASGVGGQYIGYKQFNGSTDNYDGNIKNPSLYLKSDFTSDDIENFTPKVILSKAAIEQDDPSDCDGELTEPSGGPHNLNDYGDDNVLDVSADKLSLQFCKSNGFEWSDSAPNSAGSYYVRAAFAGETIDDATYAPCFSNVRKISIASPTVYVTDVDIKKGQTSTTNETICCDEILALSGSVSHDNAYNTNLKWSVTAGDDKIKLYKDGDCSIELGPSDEVESGTTVYVKALGSAGQATITVTTVGLDADGGAPKTKNCTITITNDTPSNFVATIDKDLFTYNGLSQVPTVTVKDGETLLTEGTDYKLSYKRVAKGKSTDTEKSEIIDAGKYKVIITGLGNYSNKKSEKEFAIETDKSGWGTQIINSGKENYVTDTGITSAEILDDNSDANGIIWLKEESDGSSAWYGIDNSKGVFRQGSRFWIRWLSQENDKEEFEKYYSQLDDSHKQSAEDGKLWLFLVGMTDPDGNEYTEFAYDVDLYIELGEDWDKDDINMVFISPQKDEVLNVTYVDNFQYPGGNKTFAKVRLHHFSPYAIYDKDNTVTSPCYNDSKSSSEQSNSTSNPNTGDNLFDISTTLLILFAGSILIFLLTDQKFKKGLRRISMN